MNSKMKKSFRVASIVSLAFLAQCCCCILPVGYQAGQNFPVVQQFSERMESIYQDVSASLEGFVSIR